MEKKVRIGIVGGSHGSAYYWHEHPNCIVEAVCERDPARREFLQQVYQCNKAYESLEEMVRDRVIDAVAVMTGAPDHVRHSVMAMQAGKHVVCAVPAAMHLDEAHELRETVEQTGLTYMMTETSYYRQPVISARRFYHEGRFGDLFYTESEYHHPGLEEMYHNPDGTRTWRYGLAPMNYPTHCTSCLISVTGERLTEVTCVGWGDDSPILKDNQYGNPFWNETAFFKTDRGNSFRVAVYWRGACMGTERAQWYGNRMSFFMETANGLPPVMVTSTPAVGADEAGFVRMNNTLERYEQPDWWNTDMVPSTMRHGGGHDGAETFLTHEFVDALVHERRPAIDVYEALAYTVPGIVAHQSAMKGGEHLSIPSFDRKD